MSLSCYDIALRDKIKAVFPNVVIAQEDRWSSMATDDDSELALPIIIIWRMSNALAFGQYSSDGMVRGGYRNYLNNKTAILREQALPVNIVYQIDIVSDRRKEVDDIFRELALFFYEEDFLNVYFDWVGSNEPICRQFTLRIQDNQTTTDYGSMDDRGKLYREVINVEIPNAQLLFLKQDKPVCEIPVRIMSDNLSNLEPKEDEYTNITEYNNEANVLFNEAVGKSQFSEKTINGLTPEEKKVSSETFIVIDTSRH